MYVIKAQNAADNGWTKIYDSSDKALCLISQPKHDSELNQSGSFDFTIYPDSPFYDSIIPMDTFISAFEGYDADHLDETFYGRVLTCEDDYYGIKNVSCEGILSFLKDATVGRVSTDDKNSGREYQTSPQAFLHEQLEAYNDKVEPRKQLVYGGTNGITTSDAETFKIDDDQDFGSLLMGQLIDVLGGFFKITRLQDGRHELSYVKNYGINAGTAQKIRIGQNILDKQKHTSGEGVFTFIRPVGKDGVRLNDGTYHGVVCNSSNGRSGLYPVGTDAESFAEIYNRYGFIEKTKSFDDCETSDALAEACRKYVSDYGMDALDKLPMTFDVKLVDFFNANSDVKRIELGTNYISTVDDEGRETGFEGHTFGDSLRAGQTGLTLTVYSMHRDYENPENDSVTFYNATYLTAKDYSVILSSMTGTYSEGGGSRGGLSGRVASKDVEEQEQFKQFETFYEKTDKKFSWLATESEWDELSQSGHVTAFTNLDKTARYVLSTAKKELPFDDWKDQWLVAHPEDASLSDTELREKYDAWITANPYAIYNEDFTSATRTERIISKTGINELGENETITSRIIEEADNVRAEISTSTSGIYSVMERSLSNFRVEIADEVSGYKTVVNRTSQYVVDAAMAELPFDDWKDQWLFAHPEDKTLTDEELREKYNTWIAEHPYAIYNSEYSDATRTERIISKTGINELGENETITNRITEEAGLIRSEIESSTSGVYAVMERTLYSFRNEIGDDVAGYKSELEQTNNSFRTEIHNTISDIYSRVLSWDGGAAIEIRQGNRVFKQFDAPPYTLSDGDTLQAGDIWIKSTDMRTWGDTNGESWGNVNDFHWDDYVGDEVYVWKAGRWQRVLSEKELVVQGHRFQTTMDETWDVIDDTANGLRVEMSRTASRFYQTYTALDGRTSTLEQDVDHFRTEISDAQGNISSLTQKANGIEARVSDAEGNISTVTQTATQLLSRVEDAEGNIGSVQTTANSVAIQVAKKTKTYIQWVDPRNTLDNWQEELTVGDIWVKSNAMRKWADVGGTVWQDSAGYQWDDYRGSQQFVWRGPPIYWELINSQKDAVVNAARLETEQHEIWAVVDDNDNKLRAEMSMTASRFYQTYTDGINGLSSSIEQTASQIRSVVTDTKNDLQSSITQQANRISLVVEGTGSDAHIIPASIVEAINKDTGSEVLINANRVAVAATDLAVWGVYTGDTLTGGVVAEKLNSSTNTYVLGDKVFIGNISWTTTQVYPTANDNPAASDYYESYITDGGVTAYKLTKDTKPVANKKYYTRTVDTENTTNAEQKFVAVNSLIAGKIDANYLTVNNYAKIADLTATNLVVEGTTNLSSLLSIESGQAWFKGQVNFHADGGSAVTINDGKVAAKTLQVGSQGGLTFVGEGGGNTSVYKTITYSNVLTFVTGFGKATEDNGEIKIPYYTVDKPSTASSHDTINFKIADTKKYKDDVSAVKTDALDLVSWPNYPRTSANFTAKAPGAVDTNGAFTQDIKYFYLTIPTNSNWTTASKDITVEMKHNVNGVSTLEGVVATKALDISKLKYFTDTVSGLKSGALNLVSWPSTTTTSANFLAKAPGALDTDGAFTQDIKYFYLTIPSTTAWTTASKNITVEMKHNVDGTAVSDGTVATKALDISKLKYFTDTVSGIKSGALNLVSWPSKTTTSANFTAKAPGALDTDGAFTQDIKYFYLTIPSTTAWTTASKNITVEMKHNVDGVSTLEGVVATKALDISKLKYFTDAVSEAEIAGQRSVTAQIVDSDDTEQTGSITLSAGDVLTLYPAKKIGNDVTKDEANAYEISVEQTDTVSSNNITMANYDEIDVYTSDPGDSYTRLGQLGTYVSQCANGSWITFRATCNGGVDYKYYKIHVDRPR